MIAAGRADLKLIVWKFIKDNNKNSNKDQFSAELRESDFNEAYNKFLCNEINRLKGQNMVADMFRDLKFAKDDLEKVQSQMMPYLTYKFQKCRKKLIINRL